MARPSAAASLAPGILLLFLLTIGDSSGQSVNVALNKPVSAIYTCGVFGRERFTTLSDKGRLIQDIPKQYCYENKGPNSSGPIYPPPLMVDGDHGTWWQSTSRFRIYDNGYQMMSENGQNLEAVIDLDLLQEFLVEQITLQMADALTPQRMSVLKSLDGVTYSQWIYGVSNLDMCSNDFSTVYKTQPTTLDDVICVPYEANDAHPGDLVTLDITTVPQSLKEWSRIRFLKIKFYDMLLISPFNEMANTYNHYAVSELSVWAECPCNGQQDGCEINNVTGMYECVCGSNTMGRFCENCLPMFNQMPFTFGEPCVECNCHQHAVACIYQASVHENNASLDTQGEYIGGGVCVDCRDNTAGYNCEQCAGLHYRPSGRDQSAVDACMPCECSVAGADLNPDNGLLDCVMNDNAAHPEGKLPGDCYCKANVQGSKCDQCKQGFYNLDSLNPDGCSDCGCYTPGTVGASVLCSPDTLGQCTCKANVEGRACNQCKDGFYGLLGDNVDGCMPCTCDEGGAVDQTCDKLTGQCVCRSNNVLGRACDGVRSGFFFPSTHYVSAEVEDSYADITWQRGLDLTGFSGQGYAVGGPGSSFSVLLDVPKGTGFVHQYLLALTYRTDAQSLDPAQVTLTRDAAELSRSLDLPLAACTITWCQANTQAYFTLAEGPNLMTITVQSGALLLDKLTAIPEEYVTVDPALGISLPVGCDLVTDTMPTDPTLAAQCEDAIFSLTMTYWSTPLQCNCDVTGSSSSACAEYGGQCSCQPYVTGRTCRTCDVGHFALTSTGCTACDCEAVSTVCDQISGQCQCPDNTVGRQCELCVPAHWGWDRQLGCQACGCDELGSATLQCNGTTGVCTCKAGSEGDKCDLCADGYFRVPGQGCLPCGCDVAGSINDVCNKTSGVCECKASVNGTKCDTCLPGTFGLHLSNPDGCLDCVCMGVTQDCQASDVTLTQTLIPLAATDVNGTDVSTLKLVTEAGVDYTEAVIEVSSTSEGSVAILVNLDTTDPRLYWNVKPNSPLLDLYGTTVEWNATYVIVEGAVLPDLRAVLPLPDGTTLTYSINPFPQETMTRFSLTLREEGWLKGGLVVSRPDYLIALAQSEVVLLPASYSTGRHTSRVSDIEHREPDPQGESNILVEECACGTDYLGSSCQYCPPGLRRVNVSISDFLGTCAACECNGHSSLCDPDTSVCTDCAHNTDGDSCELCAVGFYGDATTGTPTDCTQCPCLAPRVANGTCEPVLQPDNTSLVTCLYCAEGYEGTLCDGCSPFYYGRPEQVGGTCSACECNGNSEQCDTITGVCVECGFNSTGINCQLCLPNFWGNASSQACQACDCNPDTSDSSQCDLITGQCGCAPGVTGRTCDQCLPNYWGFDDPLFIGCQACDCVEAGSLDLQCDAVTGQCSCKALTAGVTCDTCQDGFYGLPLIPCQDCGCDVTGTLADTVCDKQAGQCQCKAGVNGRTCDQCQPFFVDFSETGCTECGQCQRSVENSINTLIGSATATQDLGTVVLAIQVEDMRLVAVTAELDASLASLGLQDNVTSLTDLVAEAQGDLDALSADFDVTSADVDALSASLVVMSDNSQAQLVRHTDMRWTAQYLDANVTEFQSDLDSYVQRLSVYNASASQYLGQGGDGTELTLSLEVELTTADNLLARIQDDSTRAITDQKVQDQSSEVSTLETTVSGLNTELDTQEASLEEASDVLNQAVYTSSLLDATVDEAMRYKGQVEELVGALEEVLTSAETENANAQTSLTNGQQAAANTNVIYNGNAATIVNGEDVPLFPPDVSNYQTAELSANDLVVSVPILVDRITVSILEAEDALANLETDITNLDSTLSGMSDIAQAAVRAIDNYNLVVADLDSAVVQSTEAEVLIEDVRGSITGPALDALAQDYGLEYNNSQALVAEYLALDYRPTVLQGLLSQAETRLAGEPGQWAAVDTQLDGVTAEATALNEQISDSGLEASVAEAQATVQTADDKAQNALNTANTQADDLTTKEAQLGQVLTQDATIAELQVSVDGKLASHEAELDAYTVQADQAEALRVTTNADSERISAKISSLQDQLDQVENLLGELRQPVRLDQGEGLELVNPQANVAHAYDDITVEVRKAADLTDGTIVFIEGSSSAAELEVGVAEDKFFMEFNVGAEIVRVDSPAVVCADCWAKIYASRYLTTGHLTVQLMDTGGSVSSSADGQTAATGRDMLLTSPVYLGSLPDTVQTAKVANSSFHGCVQGLTYQAETYSLWSAVLNAELTTGCCLGPSSPVSPSLDTGSVSFSGFSHLVLASPPTLDMGQLVRITLDLRTAMANTVAFSVTSEDERTQLTIGLREGLVHWEVMIQGLQYFVDSQRMYNDAGWIQVTASIESTVLRLEVSQADNPEAGFDTVTLEKPAMDLTPLSGQNLVFGTQLNPLDPGYLATSENFAGCLRGVQVTTSTLTTIDFTADVQSSEGVSTDGCYQNVAPGFRFDSDTAFMTVSASDQVVALQSVEMTILTTEPRGILLYVHPGETARYLYVALFGGHVVVVYRQDTSGAVWTNGPLVSDGQLHTLVVNFDTRRVSVSVDGRVYEEATQTLASSFLSFQASALVFVGGVRTGVALGVDLPVRLSLVGGVTRLLMNEIELGAGHVVDSESMSMAGVPVPTYSLGDPPVAEVPVLIDCAPDLPPVTRPLDQGILLDGGQFIVWSDLASGAQLFTLLQASFLITLDFSANKADGVILYSSAANGQFVSLYLQNGLLTFTARTSTGATRSVTLTENYNDGQRYQLEVLRINEFISLNVDSLKDFLTNGQSSETPASQIELSGPLTVGGLDNAQVASAPGLPQEFINQVDKVNFAGAIYSLDLVDDPNSAALNFGELDRNTFPAVPQTMNVGAALSGAGSYLSLGSVNLVSSSLTLRLVLTTNVGSAVLMALVRPDTSQFIVLDTLDQDVRLHVSASFEQLSDPVTLNLLPASGLCDGETHTIDLSLAATQATISVDDGARTDTQTIPSSNAIVPLAGYQFNLGGLPDTLAAILPGDVVTSSMPGCVQAVTFNSDIFDPTDYVETSVGASYGCPV